MNREEQKQITRQKLLEATVDSINEVGYNQTSTSAIVKRAGLSQGILFHHFPSKKDLILAVCEYVHEKNIEMVSNFLDNHQVDSSENEEISSLLDFLWKEIYQSRYANVISELGTLAQTDYELAAGMNPILDNSGKRVAEMWGEHLYSKREEFPLGVIKDMVHTFLSGMGPYFLDDSNAVHQEQVMEAWKSLVIPLLGLQVYRAKK